MGYTHYWSSKESAFQAHKWVEAVADCEVVARRLMKDGLELGGPSGEDRAYEFSGARIAFNGRDDEAYESFIVSRFPERRHGRAFSFDFCKTAHRPYDLAVTACLLILKYHLGNAIQVSTDGEGADWAAARELVQDELGYGAEYAIQKTEDGSRELVCAGVPA